MPSPRGGAADDDTARAIALAVVDAPWGPVHVAATARAVVAVEQLVPFDLFLASLQRRGFDARTGGPIDRRAARQAQAAADQLTEYLAGARRRFDLPIDLRLRPAWDQAVLGGVREMAWGRVTSYGRLARRIGRVGAARAVGGAVGRNPIGILIPCHRVVAADGSIGGYGGNWWGSREALLEIKRELLRLEGVELPARWLVD